MLAALLLNLVEGEPPQPVGLDADAGVVSKPQRRLELPDRPVTRDDVIAAADRLEELIEQEQSLKAVPKKVREYVTTDVVSVDDVSNLQSELAMREFEYRQRLQEADQENRYMTILILEQISVILRYVQDDEEAIIMLLLS